MTSPKAHTIKDEHLSTFADTHSISKDILRSPTSHVFARRHQALWTFCLVVWSASTDHSENKHHTHSKQNKTKQKKCFKRKRALSNQTKSSVSTTEGKLTTNTKQEQTQKKLRYVFFFVFWWLTCYEIVNTWMRVNFGTIIDSWHRHYIALEILECLLHNTCSLHKSVLSDALSMVMLTLCFSTTVFGIAQVLQYSILPPTEWLQGVVNKTV